MIILAKFLRIVVTALVLISLAGCSTSPKDYKSTLPRFDIEEFFTGELKGWGLVTDYKGKVTRRFTVDMNASWEGNRGELYELFKYQNGETQERTWYLEKRENNINVGTASDVVGEAVGEQSGFAFKWKYKLLIDTQDGQTAVNLDDWLYQINSDALISQAKIRKFGFPVGEVIVFILKQDLAS